jgi:hypothetical protein
MKLMKVKLLFAWYDLWVGLFIDKAKGKIYVFPIPMLGLVITYSTKKQKADKCIWCNALLTNQDINSACEKCRTAHIGPGF